MKTGKTFIISGPSGVGKSTVLRELLRDRDDLYFSISATTRTPREGEINGVHYHFINVDRFREMIQEDEFLEYAEYVGNFYGTPKRYVDEAMAQGKDVILDIEVQGALHLDIEDNVLPLRHGFVHIALGRAVKVADILGILEEFILLDHFTEPIDVDEMIVNAVDLTLTRRARCGGDRKIEVVAVPQQLTEHGALADAGGAGDDKGLPCFHSFSSNPPKISRPSRCASFSAAMALSTTWSLSITKTDAVFRP